MEVQTRDDAVPLSSIFPCLSSRACLSEGFKAATPGEIFTIQHTGKNSRARGSQTVSQILWLVFILLPRSPSLHTHFTGVPVPSYCCPPVPIPPLLPMCPLCVVFQGGGRPGSLVQFVDVFIATLSLCFWSFFILPFQLYFHLLLLLCLQLLWLTLYM